MCISYQIHWVCDHVVPLDQSPTKCTTYFASEAKANPTARIACPIGLTNEVFKSDEVCPACAGSFVNLLKRASARVGARKAGILVDELDEDVKGSEQALDAWLAKQKLLRERVEVFLFIAEKGMVDEGMLVDWLTQVGLV